MKPNSSTAVITCRYRWSGFMLSNRSSFISSGAAYCAVPITLGVSLASCGGPPSACMRSIVGECRGAQLAWSERGERRHVAPSSMQLLTIGIRSMSTDEHRRRRPVRPHQRTCCRRQIHVARHAKVADLQRLPGADKHVAGLQVPVQHGPAPCMQRPHTLQMMFIRV